MAELKRTSKKRKQAAARVRRERRFLPDQTQTSKLGFGALLLGALLLGAGLYAQWIRDEPLSYAPYLLSGGALALAVAVWFGDAGAVPLRVGDAGVAIEKGAELTRLAWCDMQRVALERDNVVIAGSEVTFKIPVPPHRQAVAWILSEGARRVPDIMKAKRADIANLPEAREEDGELVPLEALQVTGRHCAASDKAIAFERDARLCPTCAQVYHKEHVPKTCVTCGDELSGRTIAA
jgi:hypothetical protein